MDGYLLLSLLFPSFPLFTAYSSHPFPLPSLHSFQCIIYHLIRFPRLQSLLSNDRIREELCSLAEDSYVDRDVLFDEMRNCDYSHTARGVSRERFVVYFHPFIQVCVQQQQQEGLEVRRWVEGQRQRNGENLAQRHAVHRQSQPNG